MMGAQQFRKKVIVGRPRSFGPVLYFRGATDRQWTLAALIGSPTEQEPQTLVAGDTETQPRRIAEREGIAIWRYDFVLGRGDRSAEATYRIGSESWTVAVPGQNDLRVAFTSCNGTEDTPLDSPEPERNERWRHLAAVHGRSPFHLLVQGGDQYYADLVWKTVPEIARLRGWFGLKQRRALMSDELREALDDFYFQRYTILWSQQDLRPVTSSVPSLMMWDDHDIFDGWGSHPPALHASEIHQGIFGAARRHFEIFQLAKPIGEPAPGLLSQDGSHFSWSARIGSTAVLAPDLRTTRKFRQVMSEEEWRDVAAALDALGGSRILLFVSTVPMVSANVSPIEPIFLHVPGLLKQHNDLRDQWQSYGHRDSWTRMLAMLFGFAEKNDALVLILSGEIHMAAFGKACRGATTLWQLTSSGIVNPPPGGLLKRGFEWLSRRPVSLPGDIECAVLPFFDGDRYLNDRNWLELEFAQDQVRRIAWYAEHHAEPFMLDLSAMAGAPGA